MFGHSPDVTEPNRQLFACSYLYHPVILAPLAESISNSVQPCWQAGHINSFGEIEEEIVGLGQPNKGDITLDAAR